MIVVPSKMGRLNKRALVARLQTLGTASRADLAKSMGLSQPTTGKIVDELLRAGVIEELEIGEKPGGPVARASAGRPGRLVRLNQTQPRFLGIEFGVTQTSFALLPLGVAGEDQWKLQVKTPSSAGAWVKQIRSVARQIQAANLWGILVSVPGIVDERKGRVLFSPNLHWTEGAELPALIRRVWNVPLVLVQEERALALGHQSANADCDDFLLADFGEGVGGAVIVAGKLYDHPLPISGELGHTPILGNARRCGCGAVGCLETLASVRGLMESFTEAIPGACADFPGLMDFVAINGLPSWLARTLDATAGVIAGALNVFGLRRVVITGTLNELPPVVLAHLAKAITHGALWARFGDVHVEGAPRRRIAGLVSAGLDELIVPMPRPEHHLETTVDYKKTQSRNSTSYGK